jgi:hypothetical protein
MSDSMEQTEKELAEERKMRKEAQRKYIQKEYRQKHYDDMMEKKRKGIKNEKRKKN